MKKMLKRGWIVGLAVILMFAMGCGSSDTSETAEQADVQPVVAEGLVPIHVTGETDLPGNFFLSFVYTRNLIMLDGKGNIVWSKHEEQPSEDLHTGFWDFKKHVIDGKTYYSYHDQTGAYDDYGMSGYAPGERVILDDQFNEIKRVTFEQSDVVEQGHPLDGHDFLMIDLDHYIMSGYIKETVYNVPGYPEGSSIVYSYLQEVQDGEVVWDFRSADYPELYDLTITDGSDTARDFANEQTDVPDYVHFNAMRLDDDGNLTCSFRHLSGILCLDRTKDKDQILWKLSGKGDEFGLEESQKTSCQHYVTVDGNTIMAFNNNNKGGVTRITSYVVDRENKKVDVVRDLAFPAKFSQACGDVQHIQDEIFVIGWGHSDKDTECMSVYDFTSGQKLLSVTLDNADNFTYRCVYYD